MIKLKFRSTKHNMAMEVPDNTYQFWANNVRNSKQKFFLSNTINLCLGQGIQIFSSPLPCKVFYENCFNLLRVKPFVHLNSLNEFHLMA